MSPFGAQLYEIMRQCVEAGASFSDLDRALTEAVRERISGQRNQARQLTPSFDEGCVNGVE